MPCKTALVVFLEIHLSQVRYLIGNAIKLRAPTQEPRGNFMVKVPEEIYKTLTAQADSFLKAEVETVFMAYL